MEIISHRGNGVGQPENSLPAFSECIRKGFSIELDIRVSKDGKLFVNHNEDIDEILEGRGRIAELSSEQIKRFEYKTDGRLRLVEFKELIDTVDSLEDMPNFFVHIQDIREKDVVESVIKIIEKSGFPEKFCLFAVDEMSLLLVEKMKRLCPCVRVGLYLPENSKYFKELFFKKADFIWADEINGKWLSKGIVVMAHKLGKKAYAISPEIIPSSAYSDRYKERWKELIEMGFDGICTDFPLELIKKV